MKYFNETNFAILNKKNTIKKRLQKCLFIAKKKIV